MSFILQAYFMRNPVFYGVISKLTNLNIHLNYSAMWWTLDSRRSGFECLVMAANITTESGTDCHGINRFQLRFAKCPFRLYLETGGCVRHWFIRTCENQTIQVEFPCVEYFFSSKHVMDRSLVIPTHMHTENNSKYSGLG